MGLNINDLLWGKMLDYMVLNKAISVSKNFHTQCSYVNNIISNDVTGVVNTILDYAVDSASSATYRIECPNQNLENLLNKWLSSVNIELLGQIPTGVSNLAIEYFKELWQGSSLCLLRVSDWENMEFQGNKILVPKSLYFVNGSAVYVERKDENNFVLGSDKYYLDKSKKNKIPSSNKEEIVVQKAFSRWFDKYPIPYIVRKGIYKNAKALEILQDKGDEVITKALPYLFLMSMGSEELFKAGVDYKTKDLKEYQDKFKEEAEKYKKEKNKVPSIADTFDKKYQHLIPEYSKVLKEDLFRQGFRSLLAGLGFVDIIQGISSSRKESVVNPKPFIANVNSGVDGYKSMLHDVAMMIIAKNKKKHIKLFGDNNTLKMVNSPLKINIESILDIIRSGYDRGSLSIRTYIETLGFDFDTEKERREKELKSGDEDLFYPHNIQNLENNDERYLNPSKPKKEKDEKNETQNKKKNTPESKNYKNADEQLHIAKCKFCGYEFDYLSISEAGMGYVNCPICQKAVTQIDLIIAPYKELKDLPKPVQKMPKQAQKIWLNVWNSMYKQTKSEQKAFAAAWAKAQEWLKNNGYKKDKDGNWVKK